MEFVFLNTAGTTLFVRDDLESGHWVEEQMNLTATFPFVADKLIQFEQRIAFRDPVTNIIQVFEIVNVTNQEPEHFQQITAEHIVIAELSDEHINSQEITNKTASEALSTALTGTLWAVGTNTASGAQNGDFSRGSVWDAVNYIQQNWNVYITPRIVISSAGAITGRYLDIAPAEGTWRGLRLSVRKNMIDPSVTYDESEVYTALYGYGGSVEVAQTSGDDKTEELTFADVVWTATSDHPAKPSGQTYLEWPEKTALYGRNGRPRFGYYQNSNITDAETLLEKTWESLKQSSSPKVSVSGTVVDLYRLGYKDQPIRLHDTAIIEIEETGEILQKQIICNDVDLLDPTGTRIEAGDYIPNIVYINRETDKKASGGGGGGGGRGMTNYEDEQKKYETWFEKNDKLIGMFAGIKDGDEYLKVGQICLAINDSDDILANIKADHINISATSTAHMLAGSIVYDENGNLVLKESSGGGIYVQRTEQGTTATFGVWDKGNLTGGVMVQEINGQTTTYIKADHVVMGSGQDERPIDVVINGKLNVDELAAKIADIQLLTTQNIFANGSVTASVLAASGSLAVNQNYGITNSGVGYFSALSVTGGTSNATWQSATIHSLSVSDEHAYLYGDANLTPTGRAVGRVVLSHSTSTIHYLGY
jgi:phage minor structural protein